MADNTQQFLRGRDTISTKEATFFITVNGKVIPLIEANKFNAKIEKNKEEVKAFGRRFTTNKTTSLKGTGSYTGYTINSNFIKFAMPYIKGGQDFYCDVSAIVEDKTSQSGKQTILLKDVNFDNIPLLDIEADDGMLQQESDFTFEDISVPDYFHGTIDE